MPNLVEDETIQAPLYFHQRDLLGGLPGLFYNPVQEVVDRVGVATEVLMPHLQETVDDVIRYQPSCG